MEKISVNNFPINLAQFLKWAGLVLTGGEAKELIHAGLVRLNGETCQTPGQKLAPGDVITLFTDESLQEEAGSYQAVQE